MIRTKADLTHFISEDIWRNGFKKRRLHYLLGLLYGDENAYIMRYLILLRHCEYHYNNIGLYHRIMRYYYSLRLNHIGLKLHIKIPLNVCGYGLRIAHLSGGGGILINAKSVGNYCGFNSGVLLGNKDDINAKPTIGNYVAFGPGSKAFGAISIGDNVFVAPNGVVTKDVESNSIVGGIPAKLIKKRDLDANVVYQEVNRK